MQGQGMMARGGMMPMMSMMPYGSPCMMPYEMGMGGPMMGADAKTRGQLMQLRGKMMKEMGDWMEKRGAEIEQGK